jgi:hypothetical protein
VNDTSPDPSATKPHTENAKGKVTVAKQSTSLWPKYLRRGPMEMVACIVIALGILMMLQPLAMILFTWSFATTLFGTAMFMVVSKFPD